MHCSFLDHALLFDCRITFALTPVPRAGRPQTQTLRILHLSAAQDAGDEPVTATGIDQIIVAETNAPESTTCAISHPSSSVATNVQCPQIGYMFSIKSGGDMHPGVHTLDDLVNFYK